MKNLPLHVGTLLTVAMLAGCGGGGSGSASANAGAANNSGMTANVGTTANANTTAFTSALANGGLFYLKGYTSNYSAGKMFYSSGNATQQVVDGAEYTYYPASVTQAWNSVTNAGYFLNGAGTWQAWSAPSTLIDNGDGSYNVDGTIRLEITGVTDLAGQTPACTNISGASVACTTAQTYATGARKFTASASKLLDSYDLYYQVTALTDLNGVALTAIPTSGGAGYCAKTNFATYVYQLAGQTYNRYTATDCSSAAITTALGGTPLTGITLASGGRNGATVGLIYIPANGAIPANVDIIGQVNGVFWIGNRSTASGTASTNIYYNRTAIDTLTTAQGLPLIP